ncbi:hypothetical protein BLTE_08170 [Blastochloris tepida]|uniref:Uncharacterized protein n=1 Tax=Blastochloris tepida TaxID=2233851 RepID=A0A348FXU9_9HYPH|nr:hypothetical protein BLTE_08170 [Blastochloris tepida]
MTFATNVLSLAGITGFVFLQPDAIPPELKAHDAVWAIKGEGIGSVRVMAADRETTPEAIKAGLFAADSSRCKGRFASGIAPAESNASAFNLFTVCETDEGYATNYVVLKRPAGGHYVLSTVGKTADQVNSSGAAIQRAAVQTVSSR